MIKKRIYKYKCQICKIEIESNDLFVVNHTTKTGNKVLKRYHEQCYKTQQIKKKEKDNFYKYIKDNFFNVSIPTLFFTDMASIDCNFKDALDCCIDINLVGIIARKDFKNDRSKTKYIIEVIKSNINKYIDKKNSIHVNEEISHDFLDRKRYKYRSSINFNF